MHPVERPHPVKQTPRGDPPHIPNEDFHHKEGGRDPADHVNFEIRHREL